MDLSTIYANTDPNTDYTIYDLNGQYGAVPAGDDLPEGATVVKGNVSGKTIDSDVKSEVQSFLEPGQEARESDQQMEAQIEEQYYAYLTGNSTMGSNLCAL